MTQPSSKKVVTAPLATNIASESLNRNPLFEVTSRGYGIGQGIQPKRDLSRFVIWPKYIQLQRQKKILNLRLKVPPAIAQFQNTLDKNTATQAFKLFNKYRPETAEEKRERLIKEAAAIAEGRTAFDVSSKPLVVKYGLNHVVSLIENKKPKLVLIANDVDPIELVIFLPALCRKMGVPYAIVKGKARLGTLVLKKTSAVAALVEIAPEDEDELAQLISSVNVNFIEKYEDSRKQWGGGIMSARHYTKKAEAAKKLADATLATK